jgi:hypothetical protein
MAFQTVPFRFIGGTYQSRSRTISVQNTVNMYLQVNEAGKDAVSMHSFPGQKSFATGPDGVDRNQHRMGEVIYRVIDQTLYRVNTLGIHFSLGTVEGNERCIFADDGENLVIVGGKVYVYNSSTGSFAENTNVNLVDVLSVTILNNQFIYTTANLSFVSAPGLPTDVSGLNAIGAESSPDKLVRDYAFNQTLYRFGVRTTEPWYNSGTGSPPIQRIIGQEFSVGLGAIHSLTHTDNALYWLGDDNAIYRASGGINQRISDDGISNSIEKMSQVSDAFGYSLTLQGMDFYVITFPAGNKTFMINEKLGSSGWTELSSGSTGDAYSGTSLLEVYGKNIVAVRGNLFELALNEYTNDSDVMLRQRTGLAITRKNIPSPIKGRRIKTSCIEFIMEQGIGLITGQGENPRMLLELSLDGGRSFAHSQWVELGRLGEHTLEVKADVIVSADEIIPRITISDPVPVSISGAFVDLKAVAK